MNNSLSMNFSPVHSSALVTRPLQPWSKGRDQNLLSGPIGLGRGGALRSCLPGAATPLTSQGDLQG